MKDTKVEFGSLSSWEKHIEDICDKNKANRLGQIELDLKRWIDNITATNNLVVSYSDAIRAEDSEENTLGIIQKDLSREKKLVLHIKSTLEEWRKQDG